MDQLKRQMDFCRTAILPHTTEGLWDDYPELQDQIINFASVQHERGYDEKYAMTMWLGCGKY